MSTCKSEKKIIQVETHNGQTDSKKHTLFLNNFTLRIAIW